ncbi:putative reverse transcriptase domain-containing protein [Tanacetum coccineum]
MVNTRTDAELAAAVQAAKPNFVREGHIKPLLMLRNLDLLMDEDLRRDGFFQGTVLSLVFPRAEQERLKREYHSIRQRANENSTEYMQRTHSISWFLGQGLLFTAEDQSNNYRWVSSLVDPRPCLLVAQCWTHPRNRRHLGECRRTSGTCFKCGQAGHLQQDCKKNTGAGTSGHANKKPDASGRVFALTQDHAANTSGAYGCIQFTCLHVHGDWFWSCVALLTITLELNPPPIFIIRGLPSIHVEAAPLLYACIHDMYYDM